MSSGLGGMSGAQPKAGNIAGCITVCAEVNKKLTFAIVKVGLTKSLKTWIN
jgi:urocanate hydratase